MSAEIDPAALPEDRPQTRDERMEVALWMVLTLGTTIKGAARLNDVGETALSKRVKRARLALQAVQEEVELFE